MDYLTKLIEENCIGEISFGMNYLQLVEIHGEPDDELEIEKNRVMKLYGDFFEFYFTNDSLDLISIKYDHDVSNFNFGKLIPGAESQMLANSPNLDQIVECLERTEIDWSIDKRYCDDTFVCLRVDDNKYVFYSLLDHRIHNFKVEAPY